MNHSLNVMSSCLPRLPFRSSQDDVSKKRIKSVVVEKFINFRTHNKRFNIHHQDAMNRVARKIFGKRTYQIAGQDGVASDKEIFTWFITGKHGPKLHRRAIIIQDMEVETFLRESGVNINHQDEKTGDTPLILAARAHLSNLVKTLVTLEVNLDEKNTYGNDAIQEAIISADKTDYRNDSMHETIKCLLESGADVKQKPANDRHYSLREYAITKTEYRTAKLMIDHSRDKISRFLMADLINTNHPDNADIIRYLYQSNFFTGDERVNKSKMTALMLACKNQNAPYVTALLEHPGTKVETTVTLPIRNGEFQFDKYHTAYSFAAKQKESQCAQILVDHGAKKIIPKLTSDEVKWVNDYYRARSVRDTAVVGSMFLILTGAGAVMALAGGAATSMAIENLDTIKARRPARQLITEPTDSQEE